MALSIHISILHHFFIDKLCSSDRRKLYLKVWYNFLIATGYMVGEPEKYQICIRLIRSLDLEASLVCHLNKTLVVILL